MTKATEYMTRLNTGDINAADPRLSSGTDEVVAMARVFAVTNTTEQKDVEFFLEQLAHCADRDERHQWVRSFRNQMIGVGAGLVISDSAQAAGGPDPSCSGCAGFTHHHTCSDPIKMPKADTSPRQQFADVLLQKGYDPRLGFTRDALEAFETALAAPQPSGIAYSAGDPDELFHIACRAYLAEHKETNDFPESMRAAVKAVLAAYSLPSTNQLPPDWKQDQTETSRLPKVRTSHHRNKEEAARLQALVNKRLCSCKASERDGQHMGWCPVSSTNGGCACTSIDRSHCREPDCPVSPADRGAAT